jgi:FkbM family methyltransferase
MIKALCKRFGVLYFLRQLLRKFQFDIVPQCYSPNFLEDLRFLISKDQPTLIDVGAHYGETANDFRKLFPRSRIHAFEPDPNSFKQLFANCHDDTSISLNQSACSDINGISEFFQNSADATNSLLPLIKGEVNDFGVAIQEHSKVDVNTIKLSDYCETHKIDYIDLLKIDVQGSELRVLQGIESYLKEKRIGLVFFEIIVFQTYQSQQTLEEYFAYMASLDYQVMNIYNCFYRNRRMMQLDVLFAPRTSPQDQAFNS